MNMAASVTAEQLSQMMDFDHMVEVHVDGTVTDYPSVGYAYAPTLMDEELDSNAWTLLDGYSGQYGYSGPIMHSSEYIGGGLARDILSTPGVYVALVAYYSPEEDDEDGTDTAEGWAVARLKR